MAFTDHGHHIPGTILDDTDDNLRTRARCGGPGLCALCSVQAIRVMRDEEHVPVPPNGGFNTPPEEAWPREPSDDQVERIVKDALVRSGLDLTGAYNAFNSMRLSGITFYLQETS